MPGSCFYLYYYFTNYDSIVSSSLFDHMRVLQSRDYHASYMYILYYCIDSGIDYGKISDMRHMPPACQASLVFSLTDLRYIEYERHILRGEGGGGGYTLLTAAAHTGTF